MASAMASNTKERYPGMRALATKLFQETPREKHGELSRKLKAYLEIAKTKGIATELDWAAQDLHSLQKKFGDSERAQTEHTPGAKLNNGASHTGIKSVNQGETTNNLQQHRAMHLARSRQSGEGAIFNMKFAARNLSSGRANQKRSMEQPINHAMDTTNLNSQKRRMVGNGYTNGEAADSEPAPQSPKNKRKKPADIKSQRQARFQSGPGTSSATPYLDAQIRGEIIGTNEQLEKPYFRLTGQVNPAVVRPPHILEQSLKHVLAKYAENNSYQYVTSQLQSIRQDLTVQYIETELTAEVYEQNTRIALLNEDIGEFNKCLTRLMDLYEKYPAYAGNKNEFKAYSIYYMLLRRKWDELSFVLQEVDSKSLDSGQPVLRGSPIDPKVEGNFPRTEEGRVNMLERALICVHSVLREDMVSIWQDLKMVWPLELKLLGKIIERSRARGLEGLLIATYQQNQRLPLKLIGTWLGVTSNEQDENIAVLLNRWGVPIENGQCLNVEQALPYVQKFVSQVDGKFDIKGQV